MIGMIIMLSIVVIMIVFALGVFIYEFINTIRDYGVGKFEVFLAVVFIVFMIGVILNIFGI
ncbi:hypothetical protein CD120_09200 [Staphylococcus saprophyticus]|uniref:hypothetical protein n=1 Tax=Staphylococcus saprophyticus TaxID=29385 RepID=UPI000CD243DF|nr:hypothetical protein [Staphylococcus saprophyticus]PNZ69820.1 hypothetical protein CD120_09200 [Staphylococcus saprophyticus]